MCTTVLVLFVVLLQEVTSTTEWWGDLRAHMNPPKSPEFYDVTYDDNDCPQGLRSNAIPDYVYFGTMMATFSVNAHDECLHRCVEKPRCKAVNFFHPLTKNEKGFCELLSETQMDNPRLMKPFRNAVHYEKIRCKEPEDEAPISGRRTATPNSKKAPKVDLTALMKKLSAKITEFQQFRSFRI